MWFKSVCRLMLPTYNNNARAPHPVGAQRDSAGKAVQEAVALLIALH